MILLVQSFTACVPLLTAASTFGLRRKRWSSSQQRYLHCLCTVAEEKAEPNQWPFVISQVPNSW